MTFLTKLEFSVTAETLNLVHRLCANQEVTNMLLKEHHFHYLVELSATSPSEEVRAQCFRIFGSLSLSQSRQAVKLLFHQTNLIRVISERLSRETSEDVISSILLFLMKISATDDVYLELLTTASDDSESYLQEVVACMGNRKSKKVRRLAFSLIVNLLCLDDMRRHLLKQSKVDIIAKLISVISGKGGDDEEDVVLALKALSNLLQDPLFIIAFLQAKGHLALSSVFEGQSLRVKEVCLALYVRLALPVRETEGAQLQPMMTVVLDRDLISDVLALPISASSSQVVKNMLILLQVMLLAKNERAIVQMSAIGASLLKLIATDVGSLAMGTFGLFERLHPSVRPQSQPLKEILQASIAQLKLLLSSGNNDQAIRSFNRALTVYLISIDKLEQHVEVLDLIKSLIQALIECLSTYLRDPQAKQSCIQVLKTLTEMDNKHISDIIHSMDAISQQVMDAPSLNRSHQEGIINDMLDQEMHKSLTYFMSEDLERAGMDHQVDFHFMEKPPVPVQPTPKHQRPKSDSDLRLQLKEASEKNAQLEQKLQELLGVVQRKSGSVAIQTDPTYEEQPVAVEGHQERVAAHPLKKAKEDLLQEIRVRKDLQVKLDQAQEKIMALETDLVVRDKALQKLTKGVQLAETIGEVKKRVQEDVSHMFESYKSKIRSLEGVIDTNSKLIKDLSEAVQEKNTLVQSLTNEDRLKQGKINQLQGNVEALERQATEFQKRDTQMRMHIQQLTYGNNPTPEETSRVIDLPKLQASAEQAIISELELKLSQLRSQVLSSEDECRRLDMKVRTQDIQLAELLSENQSLQIIHTLPKFMIKSIQRDPNSIEVTIQRINEALLYLDKTMTRHNFKEQYANWLEERLKKVQAAHEGLLLEHFAALSRLSLYQVQLSQQAELIASLKQPDTSEAIDLTLTLQQTWSQSQRQIDRLEQVHKSLMQENSTLRVQLAETQGQLAKYRRAVVLDQSQSERLMRDPQALSKSELTVLQYFSENHERSEYLRLTKILDVFMRALGEMEFKLNASTSERLHNEYGLLVEEREMHFRQLLIGDELGLKVPQLGHIINEVREEMRTLEQMNSQGNEVESNLGDLNELLTKAHQMLSQDGTVLQHFEATQDSFARSTTPQFVVAGDPTKKKAQTTNLVPREDGKKPRLANDYNKKPKPQPSLDLSKVQEMLRESLLKLSLSRDHLQLEQAIRLKHAQDHLTETEVLSASLRAIQEVNSALANEVQRVLQSKCEQSNLLAFKDYQLRSVATSQSDQRLQMEGQVKIANFMKKKECEAREECDLTKHRLDKLSKEKLSLQRENRKLAEQLRYLKALKHKAVKQVSDEDDATDLPDDEMVKYAVQVDELTQKNAELEYLLEQAVKANLDKDKLLRGGADSLIEKISQRLDQAHSLLTGESKQASTLPVVAFKGPQSAELIYDKIKSLLSLVDQWATNIANSHKELQRQREELEINRQQSQAVVTAADHQAKLEKYLNIYQARIQTLSSIIGSYQRHFKTLEDQIRELQGVPPSNSSNRQIESSRIEALKRMITLKDILIKHQQGEIEAIKQAIIADRYNDLLVYLTPAEKEALSQMRDFDLQIKVLQDYERQCLLTAEQGEVTKGEEHQYLRQISEKIGADLITVREIFQLSKPDSLATGVKGRQSAADEERLKDIDHREYFQRWLGNVRELLGSGNFDNERVQKFIGSLNQEIPLLVSIMCKADEARNHADVEQSDVFEAEIELLNNKVKALSGEKQGLARELEESKDTIVYLKAQIQQAQEQNLQLHTYLHSKPHQVEEFKELTLQGVDTSLLKATVQRLQQVNEDRALELASLRHSNKQLQDKYMHLLSKQLIAQSAFQDLEQTLLETQRRLIEKDREVLKMLSKHEDAFIKGGGDQALELFLQTANLVSEECMAMRETSWKIERENRTLQAEVRAKDEKLKDSKRVVDGFKSRLREATIECERQKILQGLQTQDILPLALFDGDNGDPKAQLNREKLIYELGGRDGANTALKFLETYSAFKTEVTRLSLELGEAKTQIEILSMLTEDKSHKLHSQSEKLRTLELENAELRERVERQEFQNQGMRDDMIVQQQALDVYMQYSLSSQEGLEARDMQNILNKAIENAQTLAKLLQSSMRSKSFWAEKATSLSHELIKRTTQERLTAHRLNFTQDEMGLATKLLHQYESREEVLMAMVAKYEKETQTFLKFSQGFSSLQLIVEPNQSPRKQGPSVVDSPRKNPSSPSKASFAPVKALSSSSKIISNLAVESLTEKLCKLKTEKRQLHQSRMLLQSQVSISEKVNKSQRHNLSRLQGKADQLEMGMRSLMMQNLTLSRKLLGAKAIEDIQCDQLLIQNKLLQERSLKLEDKLTKAHSPQEKSPSSQAVMEEELKMQAEQIERLEALVITKQAQILALSKVSQQLPTVTNMQPRFEGVESQALSSLRAEYHRLEAQRDSLQERVLQQESRLTQRDHKIQDLTHRLRELQKTMASGDQAVTQVRERPASHSDTAQLQAELEEVWRMFNELTDLKLGLIQRSEDLRLEIDAFKTHFSKYEAQDFKKKLQGESFQVGLYHELTNLKDERDLLQWQVARLGQTLFEKQAKLDSITGENEQLKRDLKQAEEMQQSYLSEIGAMKEMRALESAPGERQRMVSEVFEGNRLRKDNFTLTYENQRVLRECESLRKELQAVLLLKDRALSREYELKKRLVEAKNELIQMRVKEDMGEYQHLITGKSPAKRPTKDHMRGNVDKVRVYVEDLTVMREGLLKVEFRNIELEEQNAKLVREADELRQQVKDLQAHLRVYQGDTQARVSREEDSKRVRDLQATLLQEKFASQVLRKKVTDCEAEIKELRGTEVRYMEEIKEHQRLHAEIEYLKSTQKADGSLMGMTQILDQTQERYLSQMALYVERIKFMLRQQRALQEENVSLKTQLLALSSEVEAFHHERLEHRHMLERVSALKMEEIDADWFTTTQQHEQGLGKLEAHILNQRKKLAHQRAQVESLKKDSAVLQKRLEVQAKQTLGVEAQCAKLGSELSENREENAQLRGQRDRLAAREELFLQRLDFQQRQLEGGDNLSVDLVIKAYKEELHKIKMAFPLLPQPPGDGAVVTTSEGGVEMAKTHEDKRDQEVARVENSLEVTKLYLGLAELLRKTVGIQQSEKDGYDEQIQGLKAKVSGLKDQLERCESERQRVCERAEFLERQFTKRTGVTANAGYVMVNEEPPQQVKALESDLQEMKTQLEILKLKNRESESTNMALRQQVHELSMSLKYFEESRQLESQRSKGTLKSVNTKARAITPVRIRDMNIKSTRTNRKLQNELGSRNSLEPDQNESHLQRNFDSSSGGVPASVESFACNLNDRSGSTLMHEGTGLLPQIKMRSTQVSGGQAPPQRNMTPLTMRIQDGNVTEYSDRYPAQQNAPYLQQIMRPNLQRKGGVPGSVNFETLEQTNLSVSAMAAQQSTFTGQPNKQTANAFVFKTDI